MQDLNSYSTTSSPLSSSSSSAPISIGGSAATSSTSSSTATTKIITSRSYIDHVYSFPGQYDANAETTLHALNELSSSDRLCLQSRHVANRDVRILLPTNKDNSNNKNDSQNFDTFLYNFNKLALACYLKALRASTRFWVAYNIEKEQDTSTNYSSVNVASLNRDEEKHLRSAIDDDEFIKTYLDQVISVHNQVVNKLYLALNVNQNSTRVHFKAFEAHKVDFSSKKVASGDTHLFRTFRVVGLRKQKNLKLSSRRHGMSHCGLPAGSKHQNSGSMRNSNSFPSASSSQMSKGLANFLIHNEFNEVVDIRGAFDIKQFHNRIGYDCFIECEFNYFRIYHNMCNHVHHNWNSNEFYSVILKRGSGGIYHLPSYQSNLQQPQSKSSRINAEDNNNKSVNAASRRKAERLIANHLHNNHQQQNGNNNQNCFEHFRGNFTQSFPNPQPSTHPFHPQISTRLACNQTNSNDIFFGAQYPDTGRNHKSSFYFTKNTDESL